MGLRRPLAALLSLGLIGATGGDSVPIREARWIAPEARLEQLTTYVPPCSGRSKGNPLYGAVAFNDPLLLGGQAARAGISCGSCHRGGRANPAFIFPGVSGAPGTADATSSVFSTHRGDGIFNPKQIPDLTTGPHTISRSVPGTLEAFVRGQIVEEFGGAEPSPQLVASISTFLRSLDPANCKSVNALGVEIDLNAYELALSASISALQERDSLTAMAMLRAARSRLGRIAERYPDDGSAKVMIYVAAEAVAAHQQELRNGKAMKTVAAGLRKRRNDVANWAKPLIMGQSQSLYNRDRLAAALTEPRKP